MMVKWYGTQEDTMTETGNIEFYSRQEDSIYSPKVEVKWDDSVDTAVRTQLDKTPTFNSTYSLLSDGGIPSSSGL